MNMTALPLVVVVGLISAGLGEVPSFAPDGDQTQRTVSVSSAHTPSASRTTSADKSCIDLGIPVPSLVLAMDQAVAHDGQKEKVYTVSYDPSGPVFVLEVDPDTGKTRTYPAPVADHQVYGLTLGRDNKLYFSTQGRGHLLSFDVEKKVFEDLHNPVKPGYFYRMTTGPDAKIYCGSYGSMQLVVHDPRTKTSRVVCRLADDNRYPHSMVFGRDGLLYVGCGAENARAVAFDPKTERLAEVLPEQKRGPGMCDVAPLPDGRVLVVLRRGGGGGQSEWFIAEGGRCQPSDHPRGDGLKLSDGRRVFLDGTRMVLSVQTRAGVGMRDIPLTVDRGGAAVFCLANGPDGYIYGGTYPLNLFRLDPNTDRMENLGNASGTSGEIYSMTCFQSRLYMASYPGGNLAVYDPARPYKLGPQGRARREKNANPRDLGSILHFQHRPPVIIAGPDDKIYIGVMADYGSRTGSLTSFDLVTEQFKIHQPYVDEQVTGLAVTPSGQLWCLSSSHLFLWDCAQGKVAFETETPEGGNTRLRLCKNGLLYGISAHTNTLFAFDPKGRKMVNKTKIPWGQLPGASYNGLEAGPDGLVYGIAGIGREGRALYVVDPQTHQPKKLGEYPAIHAGWGFTDKHIYLAAGSHVVKIGVGAGGRVSRVTVGPPLSLWLPRSRP
jgi:streptogramin lyase